MLSRYTGITEVVTLPHVSTMHKISQSSMRSSMCISLSGLYSRIFHYLTISFIFYRGNYLSCYTGVDVASSQLCEKVQNLLMEVLNVVFEGSNARFGRGGMKKANTR